MQKQFRQKVLFTKEKFNQSINQSNSHVHHQLYQENHFCELKTVESKQMN
jgi:hypothetical protein